MTAHNHRFYHLQGALLIPTAQVFSAEYLGYGTYTAELTNDSYVNVYSDMKGH
jgi:hypothetical protein